MRFTIRSFSIGCACRILAIAAVFSCIHLVTASEHDSAHVYSWQEPTEYGSGKIYLGREIASLMSSDNASWLERPDRELSERPDEIIKNMYLKPTDVVADIGAGIGYLSFRLSKLLPQGKVLAVDIQEEMLNGLQKRIKESGVNNIVPIHGSLTSPNLPDEQVDAVLILDSYHEFSHPYEMITSIKNSLKPDGLIFIGEYKAEDESIQVPLLHRMFAYQIRKELETTGLAFKESKNVLPLHHFMVFEKRE
ncbi:MAG: class I SAM-dependent methyltransferase [Candidatus Anammoxibacter sp.]